MLFVKDMKNMKIYKRQFFLPTLETEAAANKKTGAIIYNVDSETGENISLLNATIIDANESKFYFMTNIDPYRVVLAPGFYTLLISDSKGIYGEDEQCYSFYVADTFSKITIEHSKQKVKHI